MSWKDFEYFINLVAYENQLLMINKWPLPVFQTNYEQAIMWQIIQESIGAIVAAY